MVTIERNSLQFTAIFALAFVLGALSRELLALSTYFYGFHLVDNVLALVLIVTCIWIAHRFVGLPGWAQLVLALPALAGAVGGANLVYYLYGYWQHINLASYLMLMVLAFLLGSYLPKGKEMLATELKLAVTGATIGYLTQALVGASLAPYAALLFMLAITAGVIQQQERILKLGWLTMTIVAVAALFYNLGTDREYHPRQSKYFDKVVYSQETAFQQIDITFWRGSHWYYYNGVNQFSSIDYPLYFEPLVLPAMDMANNPQSVLVVGGENGLALREVLKYPITSCDVLPLDTALLTTGLQHHLFTDLNQGAFADSRVRVQGGDTFRYLSNRIKYYDVIIVDLPDPIDLELNQFYTLEFYQLCKAALKDGGMFVSQAGSPYFATKAYKAISLTIAEAGFSILNIHNQVPSLGEWGWVIAAKAEDGRHLKSEFLSLEMAVPTKWLNVEALRMMAAFGKSMAPEGIIQINSMKNPVVHELYNEGTWKL